MSRWTKEQEDRAATAKKAHDAYALARQAMEKAATAQAEAEAMTNDLRAEVERLRESVRDLNAEVASIKALAMRLQFVQKDDLPLGARRKRGPDRQPRKRRKVA